MVASIRFGNWHSLNEPCSPPSAEAPLSEASMTMVLSSSPMRSRWEIKRPM